MSNPHIKDYASKGGIARSNKLSPLVRHDLAVKAVSKRWAGHKQVNKYQPIPEANDEYRDKYVNLLKRYNVLANFIRSKGGDPDELIESLEVNEY